MTPSQTRSGSKDGGEEAARKRWENELIEVESKCLVRVPKSETWYVKKFHYDPGHSSMIMSFLNTYYPQEGSVLRAPMNSPEKTRGAGGDRLVGNFAGCGADSPVMVLRSLDGANAWPRSSDGGASDSPALSPQGFERRRQLD